MYMLIFRFAQFHQCRQLLLITSIGSFILSRGITSCAVLITSSSPVNVLMQSIISQCHQLNCCGYHFVIVNYLPFLNQIVRDGEFARAGDGVTRGDPRQH